MKNTIKVFVILFLLINTSCKAQQMVKTPNDIYKLKVEESLQSPVNTYLSSRIKNNDTIIIITNKINNNYAIELFKTRSLVQVTANTLENSVLLGDPKFNEKYWSVMNEKYRNDKTEEIWLKSDFWNQNDFKNLKIKFIKEGDFPKPWIYNEYMTEKKAEVIVFAFSNPILYENGRYAIFAKSETTTKKQFNGPTCIVIMKMENKKWKFVQEINDGNYY